MRNRKRPSAQPAAPYLERDFIPLQVANNAVIPDGDHKGVIIGSELTTKVFDPAKGPEPVLAVTIQPAYQEEGKETLPIQVVYAPVVNGISALSKMLARIGHAPTGASFDETSIIGTEVRFSAAQNDRGFVVVAKASLTKA